MNPEGHGRGSRDAGGKVEGDIYGTRKEKGSNRFNSARNYSK